MKVQVQFKVVSMTTYQNEEAVVEMHPTRDGEEEAVRGSLSLYLKGKDVVKQFDVDQIYEMDLTLTEDATDNA